MSKLIDLQKIETAIQEAELKTSGEIRVCLGSWAFWNVHKQALKAFYKFDMNQTKEQNGILFFLAEKSKKFAIIGDAGIHAKVGQEFWDSLAKILSEHFQKQEFSAGLSTAIASCGEQLSKYFPRQHDDQNELPNSILKA